MNKERLKQYDKLYISFAEEAAKMSYAVRSKVGCVIVKDNNIVSYGFNGMPSGLNNICEETLPNGELVTKKEVLHSELNAVIKTAKHGINIEGSTIYITLSPCFNCSVILLQSGIKKVVYKEEYRDLSGVDFLRKNGIEVEKF
jgi:dCMP deaminase